jgi:hypothetical protein
MKKIIRFLVRFYKMYHNNKNADRANSLVRLKNFWESDINYDSRKRFLIHLIESALPKKSIIFIHGVFNENNKYLEKFFNYKFKKKHKDVKIFNVWYASENVRPPFINNFDCILGWDIDENIPRNIFLPGWATELGDNLLEAKLYQHELTKSRKPVIKKNKFACIVANNPESIRMNFLSLLKEIGDVDCYGSAFGNPIPNKKIVLNQYRFNLCFENDLYPNYVSEKIFDAYASECIPIWWGIDGNGFINEKAIVNVFKLGFSNGLELIKKIESDLNIQIRMRSEPILNKEFDFDLVSSKIRSMLVD